MSHEFLVAPEMYLKTIYNLETRTGAARTGDIAKALNITPGSVTNTVEVLEAKGLVEREPYKGVKLTGEGKSLALSVFRRHRLAEKLLTDYLHYDWIEAHEEACKLEHVMSDNLAGSIEKVLGNPLTCPHGNPIPDEKGYIPPSKSEALANLKSGERAIVSEVPGENSELLSYLSNLGMLPGVEVAVEEKAPFKGPMLIRVGSNSYPMSLDIASDIFVNRK